MAEGIKRQDRGNGPAEAIGRATQTGAEIASRAGKTATEAVQRGDAAFEAAARQAGSAMRQGAEVATTAGAGIAQQSAAEVGRRAEAMASGGRQLAQGMAEATQRPVPDVGMAGIPQAFAGMFNDMLRANMQIGQDMLRLANPAALFEMQQAMFRGYLDMVMSAAKVTGPGRQDHGA